ncbi:MAG: major capsid protein [Treponemataceae bacterium]
MPLDKRITGRLDAFFNLKNFTDIVTSLPKVQAPMTELLFPVSKRKTVTSPYISAKDIEDETGAVPAVARGSKSYSVDGGKKRLDHIEVQPFSLNRHISGAELNSLIAMGDVDGIDAKIAEVIENLRERTIRSTEILACMSLSGKIAYPIAVEGGVTDTYTVELGTPKSIAASSLTTASKIGDLQTALENQFFAQQATGASSDVRFLAGSDVYAMIVNIISSATGNVPVQWTDFGCTLFGKYKIMPVSGTYALPGKTSATPIVDSKSIQSIDLTNTGKLFYAALDELDARLRPLPFFATYSEERDPSAIKVMSSSKPLPAFAVTKSVIKKYVA